MTEEVSALDVLEAYRRVGVVTLEEHHASNPESRPEDRARYLPRAWTVGVLSELPDGAEPVQVRAHLRAALDALNAADAGRREGG